MKQPSSCRPVPTVTASDQARDRPRGRGRSNRCGVPTLASRRARRHSRPDLIAAAESTAGGAQRRDSMSRHKLRVPGRSMVSEAEPSRIVGEARCAYEGLLPASVRLSLFRVATRIPGVGCHWLLQWACIFISSEFFACSFQWILTIVRHCRPAKSALSTQR